MPGRGDALRALWAQEDVARGRLMDYGPERCPACESEDIKYEGGLPVEWDSDSGPSPAEEPEKTCLECGYEF